MKKKIVIGLFILISLLLSVFYGGYRLGSIADTRFTMEYMMNIKTFELANRTARTITELKDMKTATEDKVLICKIRKSVMRQTNDWDSCKSNKDCAKEISYYDEVDGIIAEFKAVSCK